MTASALGQAQNQKPLSDSFNIKAASYDFQQRCNVVMSYLDPIYLYMLTVGSVARVTSRVGPEVIKLFSCSTQLSMKF